MSRCGIHIVEHVGSAHTEAEFGVLLACARELLENLAQGVLELGVESTPPVLGLVAPADDPGLFDLDATAEPSGRTGPARVVGTDSRVLFNALAGVFTALGFDGLGDEVFRDLVIARVVEPTSLLDAGRVLRDLGQSPASYATMKRTLVRAGAGKYRDRIATWCFEHASTDGDVSLVRYGRHQAVFKAEKEDDLRKVGYSKERRVDPQIVVGLLVDRGGFPLDIGCFEQQGRNSNHHPDHHAILITPRPGRYGRRRRRRYAFRGQLTRAGRGELAVRCWIPDDEGP